MLLRKCFSAKSRVVARASSGRMLASSIYATSIPSLVMPLLCLANCRTYQERLRMWNNMPFSGRRLDGIVQQTFDEESGICLH